MEDEDSNALPTDDELRAAARVLRRLSPSQLTDAAPALSEVVDAGMKLFSKRVMDQRFGQRDVMEYLEQVHDHKARLKKMEKLEAEIKKHHDKHVKSAATCAINTERQERTINNSTGGDKKEYGHILASEWKAARFVPRWAPRGPGDGTQGRGGVAVPPKDFRGQWREYDGSDEEREEAVEVDESVDAENLGKEAARIPVGDFRRKCLVCKESFIDVHHFYHQLCVGCGDFNFDKRSQTADLTGYVSIVTGGRVRIGYLITLKLLRAGSHVIATSRFPHDAALRFEKEPDFDQWRERLELIGLELADLRSVEGFCLHVASRFNRIHILVNNAAQTLTRADGWHHRMDSLENTAAETLTAPARALLGPATPTPLLLTDDASRSLPHATSTDNAHPTPNAPPSSRTPAGDRPNDVTLDEGNTDTALMPCASGASDGLVVAEWELKDFPAGALDESAQPLDLSQQNSWSRRLGEVSTVELLRTLAANAAAPFVLCGKFRPLLAPDKADPNDKWGHIINVSALEGQFTVGRKPCGHPHTNMAKAALNMLTATSAADLFKDKILVNAVDTGWVSDMAPGAKGWNRATHKTFIGPPLDEDDGASRVLDPIFMHCRTGFKEQGLFWKHYRISSW